MKIEKQWVAEDTQYIRERLIEFNQKNLPDDIKIHSEEVSFVLRNEQNSIVGGITGKIFWKTLHIDLFWIDDSVRGMGYGNRLIKSIEELALEYECKLIKVDTFSFQAPLFYEKHGFEKFAELKDYPSKDKVHYYYVKWLT